MLYSSQLKLIDRITMSLPFRPFLPENHLDPDSHLGHPSHSLHFDRALRGRRSDYPRHSSEVPWCTPLLCRTAGHHDIKMDGPLLHARICNCRPRVVSRFSRLDPDPY